jgi:hypothetical protein
MILRSRQAILGVDPTPRGLAFVSFEDGTVQDWGTRLVDSAEDALRGLDVILLLCGSEVVVIEDVDAPGSVRRPRIRIILRQLADHARRRGIEVVTVPREAVYEAWSARGLTNKYSIAQEIGKEFPDLEPLVPPPRKHYDVEPAKVHLFDAASLVLHAFGAEENPSAA